jgi:hypothetical protein
MTTGSRRFCSGKIWHGRGKVLFRQGFLSWVLDFEKKLILGSLVLLEKEIWFDQYSTEALSFWFDQYSTEG